MAENKFKVGDIIFFEHYGEGRIKRTGMNNGNGPWSEGVFNRNFGEFNYSFYDGEAKFVRRVPKEEQLLTKINQLYERQEWVQDGKPTASSYTKQPAPSAEKQDMTGVVTTSGSSRMVMNSALDAITIDRQRMRILFDELAETIQPQVRQREAPAGQYQWVEYPTGQAQSQNELFSGLRTIPYPFQR